MRIVIVTEGGVVQAVLCDEDADVEVIDKDDAETPKQQRETQARIDMLADEMIEVM